MPKDLPAGAWESLFPRAMFLIDDIQEHGGLSNPFWTLGGGTVLMFRYEHRLSKDIDIFVPDPQYLGFVTPRLSDTAADLTDDYKEMAGSFVKLHCASPRNGCRMLSDHQFASAAGRAKGRQSDLTSGAPPPLREATCLSLERSEIGGPRRNQRRLRQATRSATWRWPARSRRP
jgi:hypothetical protein